MKTKLKCWTLLVGLLVLSSYTYSSITLVDQHFSISAPTGWSSTSNVWNFARNESATGNYRAVVDATKYSSRFSSAANGNSIYVYIPINFKEDSVYTITFYTKRACSVEVNTNELPNQTTLLSNQLATNSNCNSNWSTWYEWSFTVQSTYTGAGYFQIWAKTVYGGPTSVYMDDVSITESSPKVLPIDLLYLTGHNDYSGNVIEWATASEFNNDHFTLYRSTDGYNWKKVSNVKGFGTSSVTNYYDFTDKDCCPGVSYYTLRQTDFDGEYKTYQPISIYNNRMYKTILRVTDILGREIESSSGQACVVEYTDGTKVLMIGNF